MNYFQKKKLAFMSIVNKVKGFIRTITGALPLTLEGCVDEESIIDYTLYGQSVQNGTPTPDTPIEVESVGEKTRNIWYPSADALTSNGITCTRNNDNTYTVNGTATADFYFYIGKITIEVGTTYYLSGGTSQAPIAFQLRKGSTGVDTLYNHGGITTFSPTEELSIDIINCVIVVRSGVEVNNVIVKPMISLENTDEYEPYGYKIPITASSNGKTVTTNIYLDEPLRKVGDYADYIDFANGKVIRNIKKYTFTGNEDFQIRSQYNNETYKFSLSNVLDRYVGVKCMSNIGDFENGTNANATGETGIGLWDGNESASRIAYIELPHPYNSLAMLQQYLSANETYVIYALATPVETSITLPNIPTFKGTSIISADTTIQPSNAEITYYSNVKE